MMRALRTGWGSVGNSQAYYTPMWGMAQGVGAMQAGLMQSSFLGGVWGCFAAPNNSFSWLWCGEAAPQPREKSKRGAKPLALPSLHRPWAMQAGRQHLAHQDNQSDHRKYGSKASWQCRLLLLKHLYILADKRDQCASRAALGAMDGSIERDLPQVLHCFLIETPSLGGVPDLPPDVSQSDHSQHEAAIQVDAAPIRR